MTPSLESVLRRPTDIRYRRVGDEWVVIRQSSAEVLVLNEWAGRVLDLLDGSRTLAEIAGLLGEEFASDNAAIEADVIRFAGQLEQAGLGEPVQPEARR